MVEIRARVLVHRDRTPVAVAGRLELPFERRERTRQPVRLESGEEMALMLPRGIVLRGGDLVSTNDGRLIEIVASPEAVLHVTCSSARELSRAAYHLGNRHVPVEVGDAYLRIAADHVLKDMLEGLGATVVEMQAPFEPESGAYASGHAHAAADHGHDHGHDHSHSHEPHDGPCNHDHGHGASQGIAKIHHFGKQAGKKPHDA